MGRKDIVIAVLFATVIAVFHLLGTFASSISKIPPAAGRRK